MSHSCLAALIEAVFKSRMFSVEQFAVRRMNSGCCCMTRVDAGHPSSLHPMERTLPPNSPVHRHCPKRPTNDEVIAFHRESVPSKSGGHGMQHLRCCVRSPPTEERPPTIDQCFFTCVHWYDSLR